MLSSEQAEQDGVMASKREGEKLGSAEPARKVCKSNTNLRPGRIPDDKYVPLLQTRRAGSAREGGGNNAAERCQQSLAKRLRKGECDTRRRVKALSVN